MLNCSNLTPDSGNLTINANNLSPFMDMRKQARGGAGINGSPPALFYRARGSFFVLILNLNLQNPSFFY